MKHVLSAALLAVAGVAGSLSFPSVAGATAYLQCAVTPAGSATNGYNAVDGGWTCGTNQPASSYGISFVVTGLPPGTYTYQWSNTVYDGHFPSVSSCNSSGCSQNYNALNSGDHDEQVAVVVTDQSTLSQQTLYAYPSTPAVCYNSGFGYYFC